MGEIRVEAEDTWCVNTKRKRGKREKRESRKITIWTI